jgi:aspartyl-tRNA(Asn)/glutamyl-tRNA(Gln) amidotransferase subunit A
MSRPPTILEAADQLHGGRRSPLELLDDCLARIERFERSVHAWVLVEASAAREQARQAALRFEQGQPLGPLDGIPVGIKDIVDVEGWPTRAGSALRETHRACGDAHLVARLRAAGAVLVGKTVTTEFACFDPPATRNPWDLEHTPGGSSSGSAAAVALGMCLAAVGSQTGGSITRPAAYCGVAGCKPTLGRVSTSGLVPISFHLDHPGPIARTAGDLAAMLDCMAGYDPADPVSVRVPLPNCVAACREPAPPRLALVEALVEQCSEEVAARVEAAVGALRAGGAEVVPIELPSSYSNVQRLHRRIMAVEAAEYHQPQFSAHRGAYGPHIRQLIEEGLAATAVEYAGALAHQQRFRREMEDVLHEFDALLTPATDVTAPGLETTGDPRFNSPWSYSGLPTVSVPCGLSSQGMPVAVQWIGHPYAEDRLLSVAAWCEAQWRFDGMPPMLSASG